MYGPEVGRLHITLYRPSEVDEVLREVLHLNDRQFNIYRYPEYILRPWLQVVFNEAFASPSQFAFKNGMSAVGEAVEWPFR